MLKRSFLLTSVGLSLSLIGCGTNSPRTITGIPQHAEIQVGNRGYYKITNEVVMQVGDKIGQISNPNAQFGTWSNFLNYGTGMYKIPGIDPSKAIACEYDGKYIEAVWNGDKSP